KLLQCFQKMSGLWPHPMVHSRRKYSLDRIRIFLQDIIRQSGTLGLLARKIKPDGEILLPDGFLSVITLHFSKFICRRKRSRLGAVAAFDVIISRQSDQGED